MMDVAVPTGLSPGQQFQVQGPHGLFTVAVPQGVVAGQMIRVQMPQAAPTMTTALVVSQDAVDVNVGTMQSAGQDAVDEGKILLCQVNG